VQIRTLIVDDQDDVRLLMRLMIELANEGLVVTGEASNGEEALAAFADADPLIVVLDEMMPGMHGIEVARRMLSERPWQVIVLCSAHLDDALRERAERVGVTASLHKDRLEQLPDMLHSLARAG
jgi:DNA-binding NarL/FixJ family response regulator